MRTAKAATHDRGGSQRHTSAEKMNAIDLLEDQARDIVSLASSLLASPRRDGKAVARLVRSVLTHMAIEETVLFPAVRGAVDIDLAPYQERHAQARNAATHLATRPSSACGAKLRELRGVILDHFALARRELFPALVGGLTPRELDRLAEDLRAHRDALAA